MNRFFVAILVVLALMIGFDSFVRADDQPVQAQQELPAATTQPAIHAATRPTTRPAKRGTTRPTTMPGQPDMHKLMSDLKSTDKTRVAAAVDLVRQASLKRGKGWFGPNALGSLMVAASTAPTGSTGSPQAGSGRAALYADVDAIAIQCILARPDDTGPVASFEELRAKALLLSGDKPGALAAIKAYYNVISFAQSKDAIDFLTLTLPAAYPNDPSIGSRFRQEQVSAPTGDTTQPSPSTDSAGSPQAGSGQATVLAEINGDAKPYQDRIDNLFPERFVDYVAKANLLLLADRPVDAQNCLEIGMTHTKKQTDLQRGIEGIARCIRAENGNVAPANDYLQSVQQAQK